ncbi:hypothetical protein YC2023_045062 [Brassica napus]
MSEAYSLSPSPISIEGLLDLQDCLDTSRIFDLASRGCQFTWTNRSLTSPKARKLEENKGAFLQAVLVRVMSTPSPELFEEEIKIKVHLGKSVKKHHLFLAGLSESANNKFLSHEVDGTKLLSKPTGNRKLGPLTPHMKKLRRLYSLSLTTRHCVQMVLPLIFLSTPNLVGKDLIDAVQYFFNTGILSRQVNATVISLIPKVQGAVSLNFAQYPYVTLSTRLFLDCWRPT